MANRLLPTQYGPDDIESRTPLSIDPPRIRFVLGEVGSGNEVLDIGCFAGYYSNAMREQGNRVTGIDVSPEVIAEASKRYPEVRFECVDVMVLNEHFAENSFDVVTASEVIEHVLDPETFLQNIYGVLVPGGKLILTTQNSNAIHFRLRMLLGRFRWDPTHFRLYSKREIADAVANAGFEVRKAKVLPITKYGSSKIARLFAYYAARVYSNFGWTTGIVAIKRKTV